MALTQISTQGIKDGTISSADLADDSVITSKLAAGAVNDGKLASNSVVTAKIADTAVTLAKLEHGTSSNDGKFLRANNGADPTFETVSTDLVSDSSPQLGGHLDVNDFQIKNGNQIYEIVDNTRHKFFSAGNQIIDINGNGVDFLHGNNTHADNVQSRFGTGNDLRIFHDGSNSYFLNSTGFLNIKTTGGGAHFIDADDQFFRTAGGENLVKMIGDGAVELYHDNSKKLHTQSAGVNVEGQIIIDHTAGTDGKGEIAFGESGRPFIDGFDNGNHGSGAGFDFRAGNGDYFIKTRQDAAVELYHNNSKKLETDNSGVSITGRLDTTTGVRINADNQKLKIGAGDDLELYHDPSTNNIIDNLGSLTIKKTDGDKYIHCSSNAQVELYYDNSKRFETASAGVEVIGRIQIDGHCFPFSNNAYDLGLSSNRWRNVYTNDLHLSNEGGSNDVDGTWGSYTIQEGAEDLFLVNKRSGKKYKFNLTEVS